MEQKNKTGFLQGQDDEEEATWKYVWFCIRDMLNKLKIKADELESSGCTVLQTTKLLMREALDLLCFFNSDDENLRFLYAHLDEWNKERIVNWGTSEYLKEWLKHDVSTYRNIHEFFQYRFDEKGRKDRKDTITNDYQKFWKSVHFVSARRMDNTLQAKEAGLKYSMKLSEKMETTGDTEKTKEDVPGKFDLLHLWESEKRISAGNGSEAGPALEILSLYAERKSRCKDEDLINAYQRYYQLFQSIAPEKAGDLNDVEYVVTNMQLHEIEYMYRLHLCARLAQSAIEKEGAAPFPEEYRVLWHPRMIDRNVPIAPKSGTKTLIFYSYDIVNYPDEIEYAYKHAREILSKHNLSPELSNHICLNELQVSLTRHMMLLVAVVRPHSDSQSVPKWTAKDFKEARRFYENDMRIYRVWEQNPFRGDAQLSGKDKNNEELARYIRKEWKQFKKSFTNWDPDYWKNPLAELQLPHQETLKKERARLRYK